VFSFPAAGTWLFFSNLQTACITVILNVLSRVLYGLRSTVRAEEAMAKLMSDRGDQKQIIAEGGVVHLKIQDRVRQKATKAGFQVCKSYQSCWRS